MVREQAESWDREHFLTVALDGKGRAIGYEEVSIGSLTASLVHPREVFKALFLVNAASFIVVHNHPSGDPTPSPEDLVSFRQGGVAGAVPRAAAARSAACLRRHGAGPVGIAAAVISATAAA